MNEISDLHRSSGLDWTLWETVENRVLEYDGEPRVVRVHPVLWQRMIADPYYRPETGLTVYGVPVVLDPQCPGLVVA